MQTMTLFIGDITIGDRFRKDMGDLDDLASSMRELGLLQPVLVNSKNELVAGLRRLRAAEQLGWREITVCRIESIDDMTCAAMAELDENRCRKNFSPTEAVNAGRRIEELLKPGADAARRLSQFRPRDNDIEQVCGGGNLPQPLPQSQSNRPVKPAGRVRKAAAAAAGMSERSYVKAREIVVAAETNPEVREIVEEMDRTNNIDGPYKKMKVNEQRKKARRALKKQPLLTDREIANETGCPIKIVIETRRTLEALGLIKEKLEGGMAKKYELRDALGNVVPDELCDLFGDPFLVTTADKLAEIEHHLGTLQAAVRSKAAASRSFDAVGFDQDVDRVRRSIKSLTDKARDAVPYSVCPTCCGSNPSRELECSMCHGCGWLPKKQVPESESNEHIVEEI